MTYFRLPFLLYFLFAIMTSEERVIATLIPDMNGEVPYKTAHSPKSLSNQVILCSLMYATMSIYRVHGQQ